MFRDSVDSDGKGLDVLLQSQIRPSKIVVRRRLPYVGIAGLEDCAKGSVRVEVDQDRCQVVDMAEGRLS
jgi:hypothetical protein